MKKLLSLLLAITLIISVFAVSAIITPASGASQYSQPSTPVEGGNMLHCMCWSYNTIKANLDDIKAAGYSAVQTSCIQPPKDYFYGNESKDNLYWHFYQPIDISVANGNNWLGTKADLKSLCDAAHEKGIKIIADVVVNHMAEGNYNGTRRNYYINSEIRDDETCWHNRNTTMTGSSRYDMVMNDNGNLPDLNTASSKIQTMTINMMKDAVDCGVDGFRFDAAQNIETPNDNSSFKSPFWSNVMNTVDDYADRTLFSYGEVYGNAWSDAALNDYITYIGHVTDPASGLAALGAVVGSNASGLANFSYDNGKTAKYNVVWVESHDGTGYGGTKTKTVTDQNIVRAWAITGSRADCTGLFFARPGTENLTALPTNSTWKSTAVAEVNKFKNYFRGTSEYMSSSGKCAYNERGTSGVVISKLDGAGSVNLTANRMAAGTYTDQITGNTFTVSGGKISGTVGDTGVAVVYNPSNTSQTEATTVSSGKTLTLKPGVWTNDNAWFAAYFYGNGETWVRMSGSGSTYTVDVPAGYTKVIFARMNSADTYTMSWDNRWDQSNDLNIPASNATYTISGWGSGSNVSPGSWTIDPTTAPTSATETPTSATAAPSSATAATEAPTSAPAATDYYLVGSMTDWAPNASYNFYQDNEGNIEQYKLTAYLTAGTTCKAVKAPSGSITNWYPDGNNNNISITATGWYRFYLRPNGDGNSDWISSASDSSKKVIYYKTTTAPATEAPTTAQTDAPTDPTTEAPTVPSTEASTDVTTDAPTETSTTAVDDTTYFLGDVDGDGAVAILDATTIQMIEVHYIEADDHMLQRGLITGESLNIMDATAIQRYLASYSDKYAIGSVKEYV